MASRLMLNLRRSSAHNRTLIAPPSNGLGSVLDIRNDHGRDEEDGSNSFMMSNLNSIGDQVENQETTLRSQKDVVTLESRDLEQY
jgi:hypothetical protein